MPQCRRLGVYQKGTSSIATGNARISITWCNLWHVPWASCVFCVQGAPVYVCERGLVGVPVFFQRGSGGFRGSPGAYASLLAWGFRCFFHGVSGGFRGFPGVSRSSCFATRADVLSENLDFAVLVACFSVAGPQIVYGPRGVSSGGAVHYYNTRTVLARVG